MINVIKDVLERAPPECLFTILKVKPDRLPSCKFHTKAVDQFKFTTLAKALDGMDVKTKKDADKEKKETDLCRAFFEEMDWAYTIPLRHHQWPFAKVYGVDAGQLRDAFLAWRLAYSKRYPNRELPPLPRDSGKQVLTKIVTRFCCRFMNSSKYITQNGIKFVLHVGPIFFGLPVYIDEVTGDTHLRYVNGSYIIQTPAANVLDHDKKKSSIASTSVIATKEHLNDTDNDHEIGSDDHPPARVRVEVSAADGLGNLDTLATAGTVAGIQEKAAAAVAVAIAQASRVPSPSATSGTSTAPDLDTSVPIVTSGIACRSAAVTNTSSNKIILLLVSKPNSS